jgi:hypothetical protein
MPECCCLGTVHARAFHVARTENNFGRGASPAIPVATSPMDVTRKQRFGPIPAVSPATRGGFRPAAALASVAPRSGTHSPNIGGSGLPACGQTPWSGAAGSGESHVKRTVYEESTHSKPAIRAGYFLFTGCCGARATKQRKIFRREHPRELKRIGSWSVVVGSAELNGVLAA